jgi:hypothetical protein
MCEQYTSNLMPYIAEYLPAEGTGWFPAVKFGDDRWIMIDCTDRATRGTVAAFAQSDFPEGFYRPATLAEPVEWWCEFYETGLVRYDPEEGFDSKLTVENLRPEQLYSGML